MEHHFQCCISGGGGSHVCVFTFYRLFITYIDVPSQITLEYYCKNCSQHCHLTLILGPHAGTKKWWRKCFITATLVEFSGLLFIIGIPLWIVYGVASNDCKWKLPISVFPSTHHLWLLRCACYFVCWHACANVQSVCCDNKHIPSLCMSQSYELNLCTFCSFYNAIYGDMKS